jgi:dCTP deaminase
MTIRSDKWIKRMSETYEMISPFIDKQVKNSERRNLISYGLSSYGYDARASTEFKIFTNLNSSIVDPKNFDHENAVHRDTEVCVIPPNGFALGRTVEYFKIPRNVIALCVGKSTYARCGLIVNVTPLEPGWEGFVTLELSNTTPVPSKIYANEGICQFLFFSSDEECEVSYDERNGKYMKQHGVTLPRL